jgi:hypothetical protein
MPGEVVNALLQTSPPPSHLVSGVTCIGHHLCQLLLQRLPVFCRPQKGGSTWADPRRAWVQDADGPAADGPAAERAER